MQNPIALPGTMQQSLFPVPSYLKSYFLLLELWLEIIIEEASEGAEAGRNEGQGIVSTDINIQTVEGVEKDINIYLKTAHKSFKGIYSPFGVLTL
ncbi:hypothetical protein Tco_1289556 [Tanacetum coccineum]